MAREFVLGYQEDDEVDPDREYINCPVHVYLEQPLGDRTVINVESERESPLFVRSW